MGYLDLLIGIIAIFYVLILNIISNTKIAFSVPILIFGIAIIIYHFTKNKIKEIKNYDTVLKVVKKIIYIGIVGFIAIEMCIIGYPKYDKSKCDYVVVLGAGLSNGVTPSITLKGRLDAACKYINEYDKDTYLVVSGGQGSDEKIPEAVAMKKYLLDKGISENKIIVEDESHNTNQNFEYSKEKIEEHSNKDIENLQVKIITNDFHALRAKILAKRHEYSNTSSYSSKTVWYLSPIMYTREAFAVVKSIIFDR